MKLKKLFGDTIVYIILIAMSVLWLSPIVWILCQAFASSQGGMSTSNLLFLPEHWGLDYFVQLFKNEYYYGTTIRPSAYNFFGTVINGRFSFGAFPTTFIIALLCMVIATLLTMMSSYAFSRLRFKGRQAMMKAILIIGMFPGFLGVIIIYQLLSIVGLTQNVWMLIFIYSAGAGMNYYIAKGFFDTISKAIDEAAMIDGATRFQIFYKITLPLSKPIIVNIALGAFMGPWGEYVTSSYIMNQGINTTKDNFTVALTLYQMANGGDFAERAGYWGHFAAGAVIAAIPSVVVFMFLQKYYVSGVTGGAVKG